MGVRRIAVSSAFLNSFLRESELWTSSLPHDVNVIAVAEDLHAQIFVLLVESDDFPAIAEGELIPFAEAHFTRKTPHASSPRQE